VGIKGKQADVEFGSARTTVTLNQFSAQWFDRANFGEQKQDQMGVDVMRKQSSFVSTLDLRGKRGKK